MKISIYSSLILFMVSGLFHACKEKPAGQKQISMIKDWHSAAKPDEVVVTHVHLNIAVNFEKKAIQGQAILDIWNKTGASELFLDSRNLEIHKVFLATETKPTDFSFLEDLKFIGKGLKIKIGPEERQKVIIQYESTANSDALQWLSPAQTAGKKHPFLFTQGQAILSRTWFPCQDSPGIRFTWSADVGVPKELEVIMSAEERTADSSAGKYHFEMKKAVPAYLVALAAGNLAFKTIDERTGVFAEPEMIEKSAFEFSEMGKMVSAAEKLYGSYRWGRYDVLVLPPSFPFGGMENPCVTFATPTILAGDRSLTSLIAHELAHSWSGNLVTNATWDDFWLNEGFTVYFERRIMEELKGKEYADMLAVLGYQDLIGTLAELGPGDASTHLKLNLKGKDPDDGMNDIAYEKGYLFLCHLEKLAGRQKWDAFVRKYFDDNAFHSMTTESFVAFLNDHLLKANGLDNQKAGIQEWIYSPGLPQEVSVPGSALFEKASAVADQFLASGKILKSETQNWSSHEYLHFLRALPEKVSQKQMVVLDQEFHFTQSGNSEILFEWLSLSVRKNYKPAFSRLENFLVNTGRRKFVLPLYKSLIQTEAGKQMALRIFDLSRQNYHSVTRSSVEALFEKKTS